MINSPEKLDELIHRVKTHGDVSVWKKDPSHNGIVNLVSILSNIPKANIPKPNLLRAKNKVLDRISLPNETASDNAFFRFIPRFVRLTGGIVGGFMIVLSMTIGTAVAALESVPGQPIYPLKKIVENVQLKLATSEEQKTNLQIKFANNRLDELETILQKQKEGKISGEQVTKVVANTVKDLEKTTQAVTEQSKDQPKVSQLTKLINLSNKQTAVIQAATIQSEGEVKLELEKALESSKIAQETAIENIERAGLVVESEPVILEPNKSENAVSAEGKLTAVTKTSVNIGTAQFLLTNTTKYVNIKPEDIAEGKTVKITGEVKDNKTYAIEIELQSKPTPTPEPKPVETPESEETPAEEKSPAPTETPEAQ
ncbi:MAG TPA: DUF5667 domain-containing protein [Candidatus Binatia bacterium]|nr:DUF5667 domain-containing protein [Candidatus Binatia bacterium]